MVRVVYADADTAYRTRLAHAMLVHTGIDPVAMCVDGQSALDAVARLEPDVALLAGELGERSGVEVAEAIDGATRVVLLTDPRRVGVQRALRAVGMRGMLDRSYALERVCDLIVELASPPMVAPGLEPGTPTL